MIGYPDSLVVQGTLKSIKTHSLSHQIFSATELKQRYPVLTPPSPDIIGVFETEAGYLIPEACISAHCAVAELHGAVLHYHESLLSWKSSEEQPDLVEITTTSGSYLTKKLILTVGAWAPELYGSAINLQLRTERRVLYWFRPSNPNDFESFKVPHLLPLHTQLVIVRPSQSTSGIRDTTKIFFMAFPCKAVIQWMLSKLLFISQKEAFAHLRRLIELCLLMKSIKSNHSSRHTFPPLDQESWLKLPLACIH